MSRRAKIAYPFLVAVAVSLLLAACTESPVVSRGETPPATRTGAPTDSPAPTPDEPESAPRPNLLVITADDMRADDLRWMPQVRERLGARGVQFRNAISPNPLCCPARASFLTGQLSHNHDVLSHDAPYGFASFVDDDTLATRLQDTGYQTALVGRYLNGYGIHAPPGGGDILDYVPPGWTQWWGSLDNVRHLQGGSFSYFHLRSNVNGRQQEFPGRYTTEVTGQQTRELVESFGAGDDPWFVWWTPVAPHHGGPHEPDDPGVRPRSDGFRVPWVTPARPDRVKGMFDEVITSGSGVPPEGSGEADVSDKPAYIRSYPQFTDGEREALRTVTRQRAEALAVLDEQVALTLDTLVESGQDAETVVVFTSDNGYYLGEHLKRQGKINLHEPSIRIPLVISGPGVAAGERFDPATIPDITTTLAALAGVELAASDGQDLLVHDRDTGWNHPVVLEGLMPETRYTKGRRRGASMPVLNTVGVRLGRWKYVRYSTGEVEVYDLLEDPLELTNLASSPDHADINARLKSVWRSYVRCAGKACVRELPEDLQFSPDNNRDLTRHQNASAAAHYGWLEP